MTTDVVAHACVLVLSPAGVVGAAVPLHLAVTGARKHRVEHRAAAGLLVPYAASLGGLVALAFWSLGYLYATLWSAPWDVTWWRFAAPLLATTATAVVATLWTMSQPTRAVAPVAPLIRRTWKSFTDRRLLTCVIGTAGCLVLLSVVCGLSSDGKVGAANVITWGSVGASATFYGWTYGLPVICAATALLGSTWLALHLDARRPLQHPADTACDRRGRQTRSTVLLSSALGALLLTAGVVLGFLGDVGHSGSGFSIPGGETYSWSPGFSSIASALQWAGWGTQVLGVAILIAILPLPVRHRPQPATDTAEALDRFQ